ncbi:TRAP transporter small permease [Paenibacillus naphthalenovorans]|uniref:TRAP transporter small permease n=1 Tax=Paenibacillus naphthalenovorans TaxID=162209 RepID=UPI003D2ACDB4
MKNISKWLSNALNILMAFSLLFMCILVLGNVILRYVFDSGITWSEEMSRFLFVWMIFLGSIGALKDNEHLGVEMLVKRLPPSMKKIAYIISHVLILFALLLILQGSWKLILLNMDSNAPATGIRMSYVYAIGIIMSLGMTLVVMIKMYKVLLRKSAIDKAVRMKESEEEMLGPVYEKRQTLSGGNQP